MKVAFNDFNFTSEVNVNIISFEKKIAEAMDYLKYVNNLEGKSFEKIRHSPDIAYTINDRHFSGQYIIYTVTKNNQILAHLNCFISKMNNYMEVQTWS